MRKFKTLLGIFLIVGLLFSLTGIKTVQADIESSAATAEVDYEEWIWLPGGLEVNYIYAAYTTHWLDIEGCMAFLYDLTDPTHESYICTNSGATYIEWQVYQLNAPTGPGGEWYQDDPPISWEEPEE